MDTALRQLIEFKGSHVCHVEPEMTVEEAAKAMAREKVGSLLVMHEEDVVGILTERDVLYRVVAEGRNPKDTPVHEVMTKDLVVVKPNITVRDAMAIVTEKRFRHLPVIEEGRLLGMLSSGDLTRWVVAAEEDYIETLTNYITGKYPG